jgi:threonine dehydratase
MIPYQWFIEARVRILPHVIVTPITYDEEFDLYIKWENKQLTGSFKARGAFNKVLSLKKWERDAGLLAASAGNHGQGVALAGQIVDAPVKIFVPENAPSVKIHAIKSLGAEVVIVPGGYEDAENAALSEASQSSFTWISPYNDGHIVAGQGTIALEVIEQLKKITTRKMDNFVWLVPTSGGGLLAGISTAIDHIAPESTVIGVQSETSPFMHAIFHHGTQDNIIELPTIADGLAGPVEVGSITIPIVRNHVDDILLVNEDEIAEAIAYTWHKYGEMIEGAGAVVIAAVLSGKIKQHPIIVVVSGGNIQNEVFENIIESKQCF